MENIIARVAAAHGITPEECYTEMQKVIDVAWATTDPYTKARQKALVGEGRPTPEELIHLIADSMKKAPTV